MRTVISIPNPLLEKARMLATAQGITLSELIEKVLRAHLAHRADFRLITVKGQPVEPGIDLNRISELVARDDEDRFGGCALRREGSQ